MINSDSILIINRLKNKYTKIPGFCLMLRNAKDPQVNTPIEEFIIQEFICKVVQIPSEFFRCIHSKNFRWSANNLPLRLINKVVRCYPIDIESVVRNIKKKMTKN